MKREGESSCGRDEDNIELIIHLLEFSDRLGTGGIRTRLLRAEPGLRLAENEFVPPLVPLSGVALALNELVP